MRDVESERTLTGSVNEYLEELLGSYRLYLQVWQELIGIESKRWLVRMSVVLSVSSLLFIAVPGLTGLAVSHMQLDVSKMPWVVLATIALVRYGSRFLQWAQDRCREFVMGENMGQIDLVLNQKFLEKSMGQHVSDSEVLSASNVEKGRARIMDLEGMLMFEGIPSGISMIVSYTLLWILSPVAAFIQTLNIVNYLIWMVYLNQRVTNECTPIDTEFRALNRHRVDVWELVSRVKASGKEAHEVQYMENWFRRILSKDRPFWYWYIDKASIRGGISIFFDMLVWCYAFWQVHIGHYEVGLLFPILSWTQTLSNDLWRIGHVMHRLDWNTPPVRAMMDAMMLEPAAKDVPHARVIGRDEPLSIEFQDVSFGYPGHPFVLEHVSFTIEPGEVVALVGPTGSGKSTIVHLLMRGSDPTSGQILVNGIDLREVNRVSLLRRIGCIAQKPEPLSGTIRYNLLYGLSEEEQAQISDEEIWAMMKAFQIDFGSRLRDGLDTQIGKNGVELSGGQKQRLLIGSAVMMRPDIFLIDEATSSLDSTTEKKVQAALDRLLQERERSALVIAHRLDTVRSADKVIVLRPLGDLREGESQVETVAQGEGHSSAFKNAYLKSHTFRRLADDQNVLVA